MKTLMIVDAYNFLFRAYFALPQLTHNGIPVGAVYGFINILLKYIGTNPEYLVIASDTGKSTFREKIYDQYKINRPPVPSDLTPQFFLLRELVSAFNFNFIEQDGYEADDIIATLVKRFKSKDLKIIIVSSDKDLMQLVSDNVLILDPIKNIFFDSNEVKKKFDVFPHQIVDYLSLVGDASDNIPGVPNIGPKTAAKLLNEFQTLDAIDLDKIPRQKLRDNLITFKDQLLLSRTLVTLADDINIHHNLDDLLNKKPDEQILLEFLQKYGFNRIIKTFIKSIPIINSKQTLKNTTDLDKFLIQAQYSGLISIYQLEDNIYLTDNENHQFKVEEKSLEEKFSRLLKDSSILKIFHSENFNHDKYEINSYHDLKLMSYTINTTNTNLKSLFSDNSIDENLYHSKLIELYKIIRKKIFESHVFTLYFKIDKPLSMVINKIQNRGVLVDKTYLESLSNELINKIQEKEKQIFAHTKERFLLSSPKQLGEVLFNHMKLPIIKKSKTGGFSTDSEVLEALSIQGFEIADLILEWRKFVKLQNTYVDPLFHRAIKSEDSRICTIYDITSTLTGRFSSSNPNLQNIPREKFMRKIFIAREGHSLISADYSQIELRILAQIANVDTLKAALINGDDLHEITAKQIFGVDKVTKDLRNKAKAINFGIVYGITGFGLARQLNIPRDEASEYIKSYFDKYPGIKEYMEKTKEKAKNDQFVATEMGRRCYIDNINSQNFTLKSIAERSAINAPIQGTAADIIRKAMVKISYEKEVEKFLIMQVHDELIFEVPDDKIEYCVKKVKSIMESISSIPMKVDIKIGRNLGDLTVMANIADPL
jgi:DNA polymerase-1